MIIFVQNVKTFRRKNCSTLESALHIFLDKLNCSFPVNQEMISFVTLARAALSLDQAWRSVESVPMLRCCGSGLCVETELARWGRARVSSSRSGDLATSGALPPLMNHGWTEDQLLPIINYQLAASAGEYSVVMSRLRVAGAGGGAARGRAPWPWLPEPRTWTVDTHNMARTFTLDTLQ